MYPLFNFLIVEIIANGTLSFSKVNKELLVKRTETITAFYNSKNLNLHVGERTA